MVPLLIAFTAGLFEPWQFPKGVSDMVKVQIAPRRRLTRPKSKVTITNKTNKTVTTMMSVSRKSQTQIMNKHQTERQSQTKRKRKRKVEDPARKGKITQIWPCFLSSSNIQKDK